MFDHDLWFIECWKNKSADFNMWGITIKDIFLILCSYTNKPMAPISHMLSHNYIYTLNMQCDKPKTRAVEIISRQTIQKGLSPQGDTVNGFNQQLHGRLACVWVVVYVKGYQTQTCLKVVASKLENYW